MEDLETRAKILMKVADDDDDGWWCCVDRVRSKKCSVADDHVDDDDDHGKCLKTHHGRYPFEKTVKDVLMEKAV